MGADVLCAGSGAGNKSLIEFPSGASLFPWRICHAHPHEEAAMLLEDPKFTLKPLESKEAHPPRILEIVT